MDEKMKQGRNQRGANILDLMVYMCIVIFCMIIGFMTYSAITSSKKSAPAPAAKSVDPATATPPPAMTIDLTMPLTIVVAGVLAFVGYKFIYPMIRNRIAVLRDKKVTVAQRAADWVALRTRKDNLMLEWAKYETDVALMIDYPIMTDYTDPVIHKVIVAMQKIRTAEMMTGDTLSTDAAGSDLRSAVDEFEVSFLAAERYARRYGQAKLDSREQRKLAMARTALNIILDRESPAFEVEAAYKSLRSSLKGIIDIPQQAIAELESRVRRELSWV